MEKQISEIYSEQIFRLFQYVLLGMLNSIEEHLRNNIDLITAYTLLIVAVDTLLSYGHALFLAK